MGALAKDPLWPTRHPVGFAARALDGRGRPGPLPPGPVGLPGVGVWPLYTRDPYEYLRHCARRYGDVFRVPLPGFDFVVFNHPDYVAHILGDAETRYSMVGPFERLIRTVGASTPMMDGPDFRARRKTLNPMFGHRHLARIADTISAEFAARVADWEQWADTGRVVDLQHEIARVTLPGFLRAMFSASITEQEIAELDVDMRIGMRFAGASMTLTRPPNLVPLPGVDSVPGAVLRAWRTVGRLISDRRANPTGDNDLLDMMLEARYADGTPISTRDLKMELLTLIGGGYETVVASLSWTLALLCENPEAAEALYAEVDGLDGAAPTFADLNRLTWAKACFDEGQRLQGAPLNMRFALEDDEIGGYPIPQWTLLGIPQYVLHRDERWWPDPDRYDPTRFTDEDVVKARPNLAFIPFGTGRHRCVGSAMGYMNAQFLLALIFQRYRLHTPAGWHPRHSFGLSTTVKGGLPVTVTRIGTATKSAP
ncbi:cytochrome P450 [Nocardia crassostreae]|uniref:cytochrome P450 n=1 Tax=Nocardia crassostreae TaxID=53428 RepID=UPI000AC58B51